MNAFMVDYIAPASVNEKIIDVYVCTVYDASKVTNSTDIIYNWSLII